MRGEGKRFQSNRAMNTTRLTKVSSVDVVRRTLTITDIGETQL